MFNKFTDDYPDLREDIQVKEELHQRTDTLADRLWDISEEWKKQAIEEKTKIMTCGYVEFQMFKVTEYAQRMMQIEADKFRSVVNLT